MKGSSKAKHTRRNPKEYTANLTVLKSDKKKKADASSRSQPVEEEQKEHEGMSVDMRKEGTEQPWFGSSTPRKNFPFRRKSHDFDKDEQEEKIHF